MKLDLEEFEISSNLELIRSKSKLAFKNLVRSKAKEVALEALNEIKKKHSKMDNLFYVDHEMQDYLKDRRLKTSMAKAVFKFKTRMANFSENFKEGGQTKPCPMCKEPNALDTQRHSLMCKVIVTNIEIECSYEEIFYSKVEVKAAKTVENILKFRKEFRKQ